MMQQPVVQMSQTTVNITNNADVGQTSGNVKVELPKAEDLCMLMACCCDKCSIYHKFPECIGCVSVSECLCIKNAFLCRVQTAHTALCFEGGEKFCCDSSQDCKEDGLCAINEQCVCCFCFESSQTCKFAAPTTCVKGASNVTTNSLILAAAR
jgi:hypothetical protein